MKNMYLLSFFITALLSTAKGSGQIDFATEAAQRPIAFSVVREDSEQDLEIVTRYFHEQKVSMLMVASGGETAALLAARAKNLEHLAIVDPNPAQLALTQFKIQLLTLPPSQRRKILGYTPMHPHQRKSVMLGILHALDFPENILGDIDEIATQGVDFVGRYEKVFEQLRTKLAPQQALLETLFATNSLIEQQALIAPGTNLGDALDAALDEVMSQKNLVTIFGEKATANRVQNFSRHFAGRIRSFLDKHPAQSSAWLANMLLGRFYTAAAEFPWFDAVSTKALPTIKYKKGFMSEVLKTSKPEQYHVIHLSNIIDWLTPAEAIETLQLAFNALKPGGVVIIRQLNSSVDIMELGQQFVWNCTAATEFLHNDRSFFYRNFFLGFKPKTSTAPLVTALADTVLAETSITRGSFFKDLPTMDLETFKGVQGQFFFAVDYFSRPMAALIARQPLHKDRIDTLANIVEEHGDFHPAHYHANTFKQFLRTIQFTDAQIDALQPSPVVNMFNYALMGACACEDPVMGIASNGIIEYAFADVSAALAQSVITRGWVSKQDLVHYNLHADIDKDHAEAFFKIIEPHMATAEGYTKVLAGLRLGAYIFHHLYEDLYANALATTKQ